MKKFENKVLFIENEETLEELKVLIDQKNINRVSDRQFYLNIDYRLNYLYRYPGKNGFLGVGIKIPGEEEITLEQFKELLKQK